MNQQNILKVEQFHPVIGFDASQRFEQQIACATAELALAIQNPFVDHDTKVTYATHVFAKMLDELSELVNNACLLN